MLDQKTQSVETIKYCSVMRWGPAISLGLQLADLGLFREDVVQKKYVTPKEQHKIVQQKMFFRASPAAPLGHESLTPE